MHAIFGFLALIINFIGYVPYIRDIARNKAKPHRITWGIWLILTAIGAVNQVINGGGYSALFFISTTFLVLIVFILSISKGMGGASKIDRICLTLSVILLIYWIGVKDTRLSTIFAVIIDCIAAIPTLIKVYHHPHTETYPQWILAGISGLFTILAVPRFDIILIIYPMYITIVDSAVAIIKFFQELKIKKTKYDH